MNMKRKILPLLMAAVAFASCAENGEANTEQSSALTASISESSVSEVPEAAAEKDTEAPEADETPKEKKIKKTVYSDDGRTLIYVPPDRTGTLKISHDIDAIGENAFYQSQLTAVELPEGLKIIGDNAFSESSITGIVLPSTVTDIGDSAFKDSALESIELNEGLKNIGDSAFAGTGVKEIYLPESIEKCGLILGQTENDTVIAIPPAAKDNEGISSLKNYKNIIYRIKAAKTNIYSKDGKTLISAPPEWKDANGNYTAHVLDDVEVIGDYAFYGCKAENLRLHDGLKTIGNYAFYGSSITSIVIPSSVTEIGDCAFENSALESIEFNEGLKTIGDSAFAGTKLSEIILPRSIESCGMIFGQTEEHPAAYIPLDEKNNDGLLPLKKYKNVVFHNETDLEFLLRKTGDLNKNVYIGRIFIDLDGDNFPEMAKISPPKESEWSKRNELTGKFEKFPDTPAYAHLKKFDILSGEWKEIFDAPADTDLNLFYDRENDVYFYIYHRKSDIHKVCITENGFIDRTIGSYTSTSNYQMAINQKYLSDKKLEFGFFNGKFFIEENSPDIAVHEMKENFPHCELISTVHIQEIIDKYSNDSEMYELVMSPFADSPQPSEYKKPEYNDPEPAPYSKSLKSDKITEKNFELLSLTPGPIYLHLRNFFEDELTADDEMYGYEYVERTIDLSGIGVLSGLEYLKIETDNIINTSEIGKLKNLRMLRINGNADDLSFLTDMDSLEAIEFTDLSDKPVDFLAPLYSMKNLKYLIVSQGTLITDEQIAHISENAPWINIV